MATNDRIYYSREAEERASQERTMAVLVFLGVGVVLGVVFALLLAPKPPKRRDFAQTVSDGLEPVLESTSATIRRLEKDLNHLRKQVEHRVADLR